MKVYIVIDGHNYTDIIEVFATKAKAEAFVDYRVGKCVSCCSDVIEEWTVN